MKTYKPLPSCLTVKESSIEGLGLFATKDIPEGLTLGVTHIKLPFSDLIRTPLGGFINHSDTPNTKKHLDPSRGVYTLITTKNIKAGEELTLRYTLYSIENNK